MAGFTRPAAARAGGDDDEPAPTQLFHQRRGGWACAVGQLLDPGGIVAPNAPWNHRGQLAEGCQGDDSGVWGFDLCRQPRAVQHLVNSRVQLRQQIRPGHADSVAVRPLVDGDQASEV